MWSNGLLDALSAAIGRYPHSAALVSGTVAIPGVTLAFADIPVISRAFKPMVRQNAYDISEMAIATFLQAKAIGLPLALLPIVMAARFQEAALLCRTDSAISGPADLSGRRIGVRAYSQTTGMWLRGILADSYGIQPDQISWVVFEDAHVAGIVDPPWVTAAPDGADLLGMLHAGAVDAVIVGNDMPDDPGLRCVFGDAAAAGAAFRTRYGFVPVNHLVVMNAALARLHPELADLLCAGFGEAASHAPAREPPVVSNKRELEPALALALRFMTEQAMLPRPLSLEDIWAT